MPVQWRIEVFTERLEAEDFLEGGDVVVTVAGEATVTIEVMVMVITIIMIVIAIDPDPIHDPGPGLDRDRERVVGDPAPEVEAVVGHEAVAVPVAPGAEIVHLDLDLDPDHLPGDALVLNQTARDPDLADLSRSPSSRYRCPNLRLNTLLPL